MAKIICFLHLTLSESTVYLTFTMFHPRFSRLISFRNNKLTDLNRYHVRSVATSEKLEDTDDFPTFEEEFKANHIETNLFQKSLLTVGSAAIALFDPRADMIACLGETTGEHALKHMREQMLNTEEGAAILRERPRINSKTLNQDWLSKLPEDTIGRTYHDFMIDNKITADSRLPVQFVQDIELGYVMQRYREVHDLVHSSLRMRTSLLGEVTIKWVEGLQTGLPMCIGGAIFGAVRLKPKHRRLYINHYLPWALKTGSTAKFLQGVYFEKRWEQSVDDFCNEMNIVPFQLPKNK